jgi:hypothetical protein
MVLLKSRHGTAPASNRPSSQSIRNVVVAAIVVAVFMAVGWWEFGALDTHGQVLRLFVGNLLRCNTHPPTSPATAPLRCTW